MAEVKGKRKAKAATSQNKGYDVVWDLIEVDICKGIDELKLLKDPKLNNEQKEDFTIAAYKHSGIEIVYDKLIIGGDAKPAEESGLVDKRGFLKKIFGDELAECVNVLVEYSLLPSTLDPKDPNKLMCCSFLIDNSGDGTFKRKVEKEYTKCIDETAKKYGISIYQHPDFLYNIPTLKRADGPRLKKNESHVVYQNLGITITRRTTYSTKKTQEEIQAQNPDEYVGHYVQVPGNDKLFIESFSLDRVYQELVSQAKDTMKKDLSILDLQCDLHERCHERISKTDATRTSYYISFPIIGSRASNQLQRYKVGESETPLQGIGACFIYLEVPGLNPIDGTIIQKATTAFCQHMGGFIRFISSNYVFNLGLQLQENARKEALKSAKAAIMSRNMSHNLGSHVMSYLKQHLSSVNNMLNNQVLAEIYRNNNLSEELQRRIKDERVAMPFLTGLGQFISYLQERQDFIATIATDFIPYNSNVNFKDHIYDELNPDKRYERHKSNRPKSKKIDNLLLGYIAKSEGLGRPGSQSISANDDITARNNELSDIVLRFRDFDGNLADSTRKESDLRVMRNLDVALPGGVVGRQALFSIIENVIRNAAKHGHRKDSKQLELTFDYYDIKTSQTATDDDNYDSNHKSLRAVLNDLYVPATDGDDLYFFTLTDNSETTPKVLEKLRNAIAEDYVKPTGELMDGNKGIKEMRISAAWLRSISSDYVPVIQAFSKAELAYDKNWRIDEKSHAPILYVRLSKVSGIAHLQYIFCLAIPKKIAFISPLFKQESRFENYCGLFSSVDVFLNQRDISYEFIVFDDRNESFATKNAKFIKEQYQKLRRNSSSRLMKLSSLSNERLIELIVGIIIDGKIKKKAVGDAELLLFEHLANYKNQGKKDFILIQDEAPIIGNDMKPMVDRVFPSGDCNYFIYRSHHETENQFKGYFDFFRKSYCDVAFVEGITGDNSTDRLIRRTSINREWFYRHLHAMKSNVAIIDERLFASVFGLEEPDLKIVPSESVKESFMQKFNIKLKSNDAGKPKAQLKRKCEAKSFRPTVLKQKGVYVFNLLQNEERPQEFGLYGIKIDSFRDISTKLNDGGYNSHALQLLTLSWNGKKFDIILSDEWKKHFGRMKFNYLSVHQGLLDKLYSASGIDKDDADTKELLTKAFSRIFFKYKLSDIIPYDGNKKFFLPGMSIHSGRSKPDRHDMPQHLPFIQYAAIEHAVNDSKYSLVELLDFARYQDE